MLDNPLLFIVVCCITSACFALAKILRNQTSIPAFHVPVPKEANDNWIEGDILTEPTIKGTKPHTIKGYDPTTGRSLGVFKCDTKESVLEAVRKARQAQASWSKTSFKQRKEVLLALNEYIIKHQRDMCKVACRDTGKTMVDAFFGEILTTCEKISWTVKNGEQALKPEYRSVGMIMGHKLARVEYHPLGVVGAIVSWNYPMHNVYNGIISSLFAGNGMVVKVSEQVAWSASYYLQVVRSCLSSFGHSEELIQFVIGEADVGDALVRSGVDHLIFIGSPHVGKKIMKSASDNLTPVTLELGGKDAAILCDDFDQTQLPIIVRGTFQNCGQNCIGLERILIQSSIYDKIVSKLQSTVEKLSQGPTLGNIVDCGAMTMSSQMNHIQELVEEAVSKGARLLVGGHRTIMKDFPEGQYFQPTLLVDVKPDMRIAQEEVFGPVMVVMRFTDDNEAINITNDCRYSLGSSVFSKNVQRAETIASQLRVGMCNVNDFGVNYLCQSLPFGGVGWSGFGRFAGPEGLRNQCLQKSVTLDRFPFIKTSIPAILDYPMSWKSPIACECLVKLMYGGWKAKWEGVTQALQLLFNKEEEMKKR